MFIELSWMKLDKARDDVECSRQLSSQNNVYGESKIMFVIFKNCKVGQIFWEDRRFYFFLVVKYFNLFLQKYFFSDDHIFIQ